MSVSRPDLIVGIDFGTSGTAVAFANPREEKVRHLMEWPESGLRDKVPSMVAFSGNNIKSWGFGVVNPKQKSISDLRVYKLFKLLFANTEGPEALEAQSCVSAFLKELRKHLEESHDLREALPSGQTLKQSKVKYVFSYPTTWGTTTQARFSDLIKEAGYQAFGNQPSMTTLDEAEAAIVHFFSDAPDGSLPKPGEHILVADLGGGTSDISIFKLEYLDGRKPRLLRLTEGKVKDVGSVQIDERIKKGLRRKIKDIYQKSLQEQPGAQGVDESILDEYVNAALFHAEQMDDYTNYKHTYRSVRMSENGRVQEAAHGLKLSFRDPSRDGVQAGPVPRDTTVSITVSREDVEQAFSKQCFEVWNHCKSEMNRLADDCTVQHVVLTGGFGTSPYAFSKLSGYFKTHDKSRAARVIKVDRAQLAVCKGLVHDEIRNMQGECGWVYPAKHSYGIRKQADTDHIKWLLQHGEELHIPCTKEVTRDVNIAQKSVIDLKVVRAALMPTRQGLRGPSDKDKADWKGTIALIEDLSDWVKESLPDGLKGRLTSPKKIELTIKATMSRDEIKLTLYHGKQPLGRPHPITETWHKTPEDEMSRVKEEKPKWWKFSAEQVAAFAATAGFVGAVAAVVALVFAGKEDSKSKKDDRSAVDHQAVAAAAAAAAAAVDVERNAAKRCGHDKDGQCAECQQTEPAAYRH